MKCYPFKIKITTLCYKYILQVLCCEYFVTCTIVQVLHHEYTIKHGESITSKIVTLHTT